MRRMTQAAIFMLDGGRVPTFGDGATAAPDDPTPIYDDLVFDLTHEDSAA